MALLEVKDLHTSFFTDAGEVRAVNGVSFTLDRGRVLGIVGEIGFRKVSYRLFYHADIGVNRKNRLRFH